MEPLLSLSGSGFAGLCDCSLAAQLCLTDTAPTVGTVWRHIATGGTLGGRMSSRVSWHTEVTDLLLHSLSLIGCSSLPTSFTWSTSTAGHCMEEWNHVLIFLLFPTLSEAL